MPFNKIDTWYNNHTRLNESNMNKIRDVLLDFRTAIYGSDENVLGGLKLESQESKHKLTGGIVGDIKYIGFKNQIETIGCAVFSHNFSTIESPTWDDAALAAVLNHTISIPRTTDDDGNNIVPESWETGSQPRYTTTLCLNPISENRATLVGNESSFLAQFAKALNWQSSRILSISKHYSPTQIALKIENNTYPAPVINAYVDTLPALRIQAGTNNSSGQTEYKTMLQVKSFDTDETPRVWMADACIDSERDESTLDAHSIIKLGDAKELSDVKDLTTQSYKIGALNTLSGERVAREAGDNALSLAIQAIVSTREELMSSYFVLQGGGAADADPSIN